MIRKKNKKKEEDNHDRWLVSYADYITLLFAFFVILFATSERNTDKGKQFEQSVKKYLIKIGAVGVEQKNLNKDNLHNSPIESPIKKHDKTDEKTSQLQSKVEAYLERTFQDKEIEEIIQDISAEEVGVRVTFKAETLFSEESDAFKSSAQRNLNKLGELFKKLEYRVYIENHTYPMKNDWQLTANRSTKLAQFFIDNYSISPSRIAAISYGASRPVIPIGSKNKSATNDRVDFLILTEDIGL
ncbi:MAG: OmpA family protein [Bdellovibrionaceae bacterium]|nr:OmpA family protein [Pseudobdellovibrionaceae bacterium]